MKTLQIGMNLFSEQEGGGLDRYYYDCMRYLSDSGVEMVGLATSSAGVTNTNSKIHTFAPRNASLLERWYGVRKTAHRLLKEQDYSLFAAHFVLYAFPILDKLRQRPLVMHFHGPWSLESVVEGNKSFDIRFRKSIEQAVYRQSASFIVLSKAFQTILHQQYQIPLDRIHVVPGGVDFERFQTPLSRTTAREQLGWPQDRFILFAVRRLSKRMGLENLIAAMQKVQIHQKDPLLLIAGRGELGSTLQNQIEELGLTEHVRLLGYIPDHQLPLAYRAADISVVPTTTLEGFGLIVLESLAVGTPVLGTPVGGIPEILRPFCEDLIFEGLSIDQLAQGILDILSGQRRLPSSEVCQKYVSDHYTWPVIAEQIKSVYQSVLDNS
jgi:glycosyltransferase involved in cell wall biosynthesis